MKKLKYFRDANIPMILSPRVRKSIPTELCQNIFSLAFRRAKELEEKDIETSSVLIVTVNTEKYNGMFTRCSITMEQEQPDYETQHKALIMGDFKIDTRLYLIESWNGKTKNVTEKDHYITLLLPEEY